MIECWNKQADHMIFGDGRDLEIPAVASTLRLDSHKS